MFAHRQITSAGKMRQKSILEPAEDFDFDSDVSANFEDAFPVEISNEVPAVSTRK